MNRLRSDEGFSLAEMLVVIALMGIVMIATYSGLTLTNRANEIQTKNSFVATSIAVPMQVMDVVLSQNTQIDTGSGDYLLSCLTDQDNNNVRERHVFQAQSNGTFSETVYMVDSAGANVSLVRSTIWQKNTTDPPSRNVNVASAKPVFSYYSRDEAGALQATTPQDATEAVIYLEATYKDQPYSESRRVLFRNR